MHLLKRMEGITMKKIFTNYFIYLFSLEAKGYLWSITRVKKWVLGYDVGFYNLMRGKKWLILCIIRFEFVFR